MRNGAETTVESRRSRESRVRGLTRSATTFNDAPILTANAIKGVEKCRGRIMALRQWARHSQSGSTKTSLARCRDA